MENLADSVTTTTRISLERWKGQGDRSAPTKRKNQTCRNLIAYLACAEICGQPTDKGFILTRQAWYIPHIAFYSNLKFYDKPISRQSIQGCRSEKEHHHFIELQLQ